MVEESRNHYDVAIIGAGMAGMAAAIRLAHFGKKVCVFERHLVMGGLNSFWAYRGRKYDVGLHAMTNYVADGRKGTPLGKLLRQLRIDRDELGLCPQNGSRIAFPGISLAFTNDPACLEAEIARGFPREIDGYRRLVSWVKEYDDRTLRPPEGSAREIMRRFIGDRLLEDMLLCPLLYYGSARPNDMDPHQFVIMFKSIYLEGFARPFEGVRRVIKVLLEKMRTTGAQRRMNCGVKRLLHDGVRVTGLELDSGEQVSADRVISSIGALETRRLWEEPEIDDRHPEAGRLSFVETIGIFDGQPEEWGWRDTIIFFNDSERLHYEEPPELVDPRSGVVCVPNNFDYGGRRLKEGWLRATCLANYERWVGLDEARYQREKVEWFERIQEKIMDFLPPVPSGGIPAERLATDMFTPRTIKKYTGHFNGAVYGAPRKVMDGRTGLENLFLCGTDQGYLGIVGAILSGVSMANLHVLQGQ